MNEKIQRKSQYGIRRVTQMQSRYLYRSIKRPNTTTGIKICISSSNSAIEIFRFFGHTKRGRSF